jgi:hypothetical protein
MDIRWIPFLTLFLITNVADERNEVPADLNLRVTEDSRGPFFSLHEVPRRNVA